jgi:Na+/melibiose symporter-like transporter
LHYEVIVVPVAAMLLLLLMMMMMRVNDPPTTEIRLNLQKKAHAKSSANISPTFYFYILSKKFLVLFETSSI